MARADADWEAIKRDYRLGRGSIREIAKRYGVGHQSILRHAKKGGWTQDKAPEVKRRVAERLLLSGPDRTSRTDHPDRSGTRPSPTVTEADIEAAVDERVAVLREHQAVGRDFRRTIAGLRRELDEVSQLRVEIEDTIEEETSADKSGDRRNRMLRAVSLPARANAAAVLTTGLKNAVAIERAAHNMADAAAAPPADITVIELSGPDD